MEARKTIAVISENLAEPWDEGIKKLAYSLAAAIKKKHEIRMFNIDRGGGESREAERIPGTRTFVSWRLISAIRAASPRIIIYVPSPSVTFASFIRSRMLKLEAPRARVGMIATIARRHPAFILPILKAAAPDAVFVPSYASLLYLSKCSIQGVLLPFGADPGVFKPPGDGEQAELRKRYGVPSKSYVYLHAGHLSAKRNLGPLCSLQRNAGCDVVVVGSTSTSADAVLRQSLESAGIRVITEFVKIEEFYRLADCYVFPVRDVEGCIEFPLSVVEALASGLPVLSAPFGGLRDFLPEGPDLQYWEDTEELLAKAETLRSAGKPEVRDMRGFSWEKIADRVLTALGD